MKLSLVLKSIVISNIKIFFDERIIVVGELTIIRTVTIIIRIRIRTVRVKDKG